MSDVIAQAEAGKNKGLSPADFEKRVPFAEYPKLLYPPEVEVKSAEHEQELRARWRRPLPWSAIEEKERVERYYAEETYPKWMKPPAIKVHSEEEEAGQRALLSIEDDGDGHPEDDAYPAPKFLFHASQQPRMVKSRSEAEALGPGWYETPAEAVAAAHEGAAVYSPEFARASKAVPAPSDPDAMTRSELFAFLRDRGQPARPPITLAELRLRVKAILAA